MWSRSYSLRGLYLIVLAPWLCYGRTWVQVIDTSIYESALNDPYRSAFTFESMNLLPTVDEVASSLLPTPAPLASIIAVQTTNYPTPQAPTMSPSQHVKCLAETESLYNIQFMDSWGDGWSGTWLEISKDIQTIFSTGSSTRTSVYNGTLHDGASSEAFVCLSRDICYNLFTGGGKWEDEVKWSIREVFDENIDDSKAPVTLVKGTAPIMCRFSIPGEDGTPSTCPVSCWTPTAVPTTSSSHNPTVSPTETVSDRPSMIPSSNHANPSNIDSKLGSTALPLPTIPPSNSSSPTNLLTSTMMPTNGNLVRKPSFFEPYVKIKLFPSVLTIPTFSPVQFLSDSPSQVPNTNDIAEAPSPAPTGGDAVIAIEAPTVSPTGGDAILVDTPTQSPTRIFSVRVGESDWIWPTSSMPTSMDRLGSKSLPQTNNQDTAFATLPPSDNRASPATSFNAPNENPTSLEPTKSPSLSRSSHFFLQLQENLAAMKESDEVLASDYPSGAPSIRRGFFT